MRGTLESHGDGYTINQWTICVAGCDCVTYGAKNTPRFVDCAPPELICLLINSADQPLSANLARLISNGTGYSADVEMAWKTLYKNGMKKANSGGGCSLHGIPQSCFEAGEQYDCARFQKAEIGRTAFDVFNTLNRIKVSWEGTGGTGSMGQSYVEYSQSILTEKARVKKEIRRCRAMMETWPFRQEVLEALSLYETQWDNYATGALPVVASSDAQLTYFCIKMQDFFRCAYRKPLHTVTASLLNSYLHVASMNRQLLTAESVRTYAAARTVYKPSITN